MPSPLIEASPGLRENVVTRMSLQRSRAKPLHSTLDLSSPGFFHCAVLIQTGEQSFSQTRPLVHW